MSSNNMQINININNSECPICIEQIKPEINCVITECGHCFHTSCLMQNIAHNGLSCPYCRAKMATEIKDNDSDDASEYTEITDSENNIISDFALRGARWLFQRSEGETIDEDEEDINDEYNENEENDENNDENNVNTEYVPPIESVIEKIKSNMSIDDVIMACLYNEDPEYENVVRVTQQYFKFSGILERMIQNHINSNNNNSNNNSNINSNNTIDVYSEN